MSFRLLLTALLLGLSLAAAPRARAQTQPQSPPPAGPSAAPALPAPTTALADSSLRCATYSYLSFLIYDAESGPEPVVAEGVGGTLTLRPDGRFEQRLQLGLAPKTTVFERNGRYELLGDNQLRFSYITQQGKPRTDTGRYRYEPQRGGLVIRIDGFPAGSYSVYTLVDSSRGPATQPPTN